MADAAIFSAAAAHRRSTMFGPRRRAGVKPASYRSARERAYFSWRDAAYFENAARRFWRRFLRRREKGLLFPTSGERWGFKAR